MMKHLIISVLLILFIVSALSAQIKLEPSELIKPSLPILLAENINDNDNSFSEVKIPLFGQKEVVHKNPWKAFGMSLVLPGSGEYYVGKTFRSRAFFLAEVGLWSAFISFKHLSNWKEDDYKLLAQTHAGANLTDKDERFFDLLGFYDNREEYNKLAGAFTRNRDYFSDNEFYFWNWDSDKSREYYRDLKNDSRSFNRNADFALGLIVANHFLSAVDAFWAAKRSNRNIGSGFSGIDLQLLANGGFQITLKARI